MKRLILLSALLISLFANAQTPQVGYVVPTITGMKNYFGNANRITVTATNEDFTICSSCVPDESTVYAGAGGRKWKKVVAVDITKLPIAKFTADSATLAAAAAAAMTAANSKVPLTKYQLDSAAFSKASKSEVLLNKNIDFGAGKGNSIANVPFTSINSADLVDFDPTTKQDVLQPGTTIKTYGGVSTLGAGNIEADSISAFLNAPTTGNKNFYFDKTLHKLGVLFQNKWYYFGPSDSVALAGAINQNLITFSEEFDNASWTKVGGGTITPNTILAPDGTLSADTYTAGVGAYAGILRKNFVYSNGTYVGSVYIKRNNWNYVGLRVAAGAGSGGELWGTNTPFIDLNDHVTYLAGANPTTAIHMTDVGDGWYRLDVSYTLTTSTGTLDYFDICIVDNNGEISTARDGTEKVYLWGADLNTGSLKAYSKTTTTANP